MSLVKNIWFDKAHLDIETNLLALKIFLLDKFSYKFVISELWVSKPTINYWCSFGREVCVNWVFSRCKKIGGEGKVVEIDESKFGKRKYNVGRAVEGQWPGYNFKALFCTAAHLSPQFPCLGLSIQNFVLLPFWLNN